MRVHDDRAADQLARRHRADAVTVGRDVYFRQDRLRPRDPQGFGLVAHEATHVAEFFAPGAAWRRLTGGAQQEEERLAEANERRASHDGRPGRHRGARCRHRRDGSRRRGGLPPGRREGGVTPERARPGACDCAPPDAGRRRPRHRTVTRAGCPSAATRPAGGSEAAAARRVRARSLIWRPAINSRSHRSSTPSPASPSR